MKELPEEMRREIRGALQDAKSAAGNAGVMLNNPSPYPPESLEDALNAVQDAGYRARRAFRVDAGAGGPLTSSEARRRDNGAAGAPAASREDAANPRSRRGSSAPVEGPLTGFRVGNREVMDDLGEEREGNIIRASAASVDIEDDYGTVWRFWGYPFRTAAAEIVRSQHG